MDHDIAALLIISYAQESTKIFSSKVLMYNLTVTHLGAYGQRERGRRGKEIRDFVGIG